MPDKILAEKVKLVKGGNMAKERFTVLLCCGNGEKLKPLVIGKTQRPGITIASYLKIKQQGMDDYYYFY